MAGKQSLEKNNREALFNKHRKSLLNQVNLWYIKDKFAIKTDFSENQALLDYLMVDTMSSTNCEIDDFINRRLLGALGDAHIDIVELKSMQIKYRAINNYYYTAPTWQPNVEW